MPGQVKDHVPELRDNIVARVLRPVTEPNAAEDLKEDRLLYKCRLRVGAAGIEQLAGV